MWDLALLLVAVNNIDLFDGISCSVQIIYHHQSKDSRNASERPTMQKIIESMAPFVQYPDRSGDMEVGFCLTQSPILLTNFTTSMYALKLGAVMIIFYTIVDSARQRWVLTEGSIGTQV